jgi:hypothetical protein
MMCDMITFLGLKSEQMKCGGVFSLFTEIFRHQLSFYNKLMFVSAWHICMYMKALFIRDRIICFT